MLLHVVESTLPVQLAGDLATRDVSADEVNHLPVPVHDAGHGITAQCAEIGRLPSAVRIEGCAVEHYLGLPARLRTSHHPRGELCLVRVALVEPFGAARHPFSPPTFLCLL